MTENLAIVAQRIIDTREQMDADYETLKRAREADRLRHLEVLAKALVSVATGEMPLKDLGEILHSINVIHADLRDANFSAPDLREFLEP